MKRVRWSKNRLVLRLGPHERQVFFSVLKLYPRVPPAHHRLSRSATLPDRVANQRLLDEALADQRAENKAKVAAFLANPKRVRNTEAGTTLTLQTGDTEWLFEVLNDVRVGSWLLLGSPEGRLEALTEETAPHAWAMEMAGYFEAELLEALEGDHQESPPDCA